MGKFMSLGYLEGPRIVGVLRGGLGNQLFQLVGLIAHATSAQRRLVVDCSTFKHPSQIALGRKVEVESLLDHFGIQKIQAGTNASIRVRVALQMALRVTLDANPWLDALPIVASDKVQSSRLARRTQKKLCYIDSYFSDTFELPFYSAAFNAVLELLVAGSNAREVNPLESRRLIVNVHLRLGDTKSDNNSAGFELEGMIEHLRRFQELGHDLQLFSDETTLAKGLLESEGITGVRESKSTGAMATLLELSSCDILIGSPSTYSYWAGLVAAQHGAKILFPKSGVSSSLVAPKGWDLY